MPGEGTTSDDCGSDSDSGSNEDKSKNLSSIRSKKKNLKIQKK